MRLFSTDIDGTIYDGPESASLFQRFWSGLRENGLSPLLVYNTGRSKEDTLRLLERTNLPTPDFLICGVGTVIFDFGEKSDLHDWSQAHSESWDYDQVHELVGMITTAREQPAECQNPHKSSWYWENAEIERIRSLVQEIEERGFSVQAVYSSKRDLDILPASANKGNAVAWLADRLGIPIEEVIVAGDSGNDASMFLIPGVRGITPANAERALISATVGIPVFRSAEPCAMGVTQVLATLLCHNPIGGPHG